MAFKLKNPSLGNIRFDDIICVDRKLALWLQKYGSFILEQNSKYSY